jgi:hypothetical protein
MPDHRVRRTLYAIEKEGVNAEERPQLPGADYVSSF